MGFLLLQLFSIVLIYRLLVQLAVECLRLENARSLTFHVVWQFDDVLAGLDSLVAHHEIKERAEDANADSCIIALIVIEESCEQVDQRGGQVLLFADVPNMRGVRIFCQIQVQYGFLKKLDIGLTVEFNQTRQNVVGNDCLLKPSRKNECVQVLEVPLLHASFSEHLKQTAKQVVDCTDSDAELGSDA